MNVNSISVQGSQPPHAGLQSVQHDTSDLNSMRLAKLSKSDVPSVSASQFQLGEFPFGGGLDLDKRRAALQSIDSAMSTVDLPMTPSKLFTEPARGDASPFTLQSLDFLNDEHTESLRPAVRLKLATAPADFHFNRQELTGQAFPHFATPKARLLVPDRGSSNSAGTPPIPPAHGKDSQRGQPGNSGVELSEKGQSLGTARGGSVPSASSGAAANEEWAKAEVRKYCSGANPRKTEQNRRAQARFRQRKKDMFLEQQRQIQELTQKLDQAMQEKKSFQEKTSMLQKMVEAKEKRIEALKSQNKDSGSLDELVDACWDFVMELKKGRQGLNYTRGTVAEMVAAMVNWGSPALGAIRREVVEQLCECLKQNGDHVDTPANLWLNDLVEAYERMVHRCGECHPQACKLFLGLQLPEQNGRTADAAFWKTVLEAGGIRMDQRSQLSSARNSLITKMQQLVGRRRDIAHLVQSGGPENALNQQPLLGNMAQAQHVLDLHAQILKEEQAAVFNFLTIVRLVLEPVQQAKLMVASFPFALDTLAICSLIANEGDSLSMLNGNLALLSQLPSDSPFRALTPNSSPLPPVQTDVN